MKAGMAVSRVGMRLAGVMLAVAGLGGAGLAQSVEARQVQTPLVQVQDEQQSQQQVLAATPPMGWNSWDAYGTTVRGSEVRANADYMAKYLRKFGWEYIVVDIEWYAVAPKTHGYIPRGEVAMDEYGRFIPAVGRFPTAANGVGFKALADYIHGKGLKMGIHVMRGIPRDAVDKNLPIEGSQYHAADVADKVHVAPWKGMEDTYGVDMTKPGAQDWYDSEARLYASWGLDFIKADDMSAPYHGAEIHALSVALAKAGKAAGRPIVLSLSPGAAPLAQHEDMAANAQMWRISGDFWDNWAKLKKQFDLTHAWEQFSGPGHWPDADMLPMGFIGLRAEVGEPRKTAFTPDEQRTMMTLWSMFRSPLMMGGDLPSNDASTLELMTNPEVLAVDQNSTGGHEVYRDGNTIAWVANKPASEAKYVAVFNVGDTAERVNLALADVGVTAARVALRNLWELRNLGTADKIAEEIPPHACVLYLATPATGSGQVAYRIRRQNAVGLTNDVRNQGQHSHPGAD
jgi:alpha-galactosidase